MAACALLAQTRLKGRESAVLIGAIALAGLHPRYTWPPPYSSAVWAALVLVAAIVILATAARGGREGGSRPAPTSSG